MVIPFDNSEPVIINVPPGSSLLPGRKFRGEIEQFANKRLILLSDEQIDVSTGITAQGKDLLFMGRVVECLAETDNAGLSMSAPNALFWSSEFCHAVEYRFEEVIS